MAKMFTNLVKHKHIDSRSLARSNKRNTKKNKKQTKKPPSTSWSNC